MQKKPTVILDFDDVLVDRKILKQDIFKLVQSFGVSLRRAKQSYKELRVLGVFPPAVYSKLIFPKDILKRRGLLKALRGLVAKPRAYNFKDVEIFLKQLKIKYNLILVTYGNKGWQQRKIKQSELVSYFSKIYITQDKAKRRVLKNIAVKTNRRAVLLDDDFNFCASALAVGLNAIQVKVGDKDWNYYRELIKQVDKLFS